MRTLDILASADVIAAEDTRSLRRLMEIHGVPLNGRLLMSYHDHSGEGVRGKVLTLLAEGKSVAYASEAGTPLIADPGYHLSLEVSQAGHLITSAPGPSAITTALTLAGLPTDAFFLAGFLPNAKSARRARLQTLKDVPGTLGFYESPKRVGEMLKDAALVLGEERDAALCRELTKKFEEVRRGTLAELSEKLAQEKVKGEIVVLIDRAQQQETAEADLEDALRQAMQTMSLKDASETVAVAFGEHKRKIYQMALALKDD